MAYQKFITQTLKEASKIANKMFGKVSGKTKPHDPAQILTKADLAVGKLVVNKIKKAYPHHNIIDEERGVVDKKSKYTWVIDPIDGTANFAQGVPQYGIIIGLLNGGEPLAGGIALPFYGDICVAQKGKGSYNNKKKLDISNSAKISSRIISSGLGLLPGDPDYTRRAGKIVAEIVVHFPLHDWSASTYDSVLVAEGKYAGEIKFVSKIWDNIGQHIVIEEAGGIYTDLYGRPMDYSKPWLRTKQNYTYCAASPRMYKELQKIIHLVK